MARKQAKPSKPPGTDWTFLLVAALVYGAMYAATAYFFAETPAPLPPTADPLLFSEGRVMRHLHRLADEIGHRQVGSVGEEAAAQYLLSEAQKIAAEAAANRPDLVVEAVRESVSGGITMHAFKFEIANVYRNLTNVVLRVAPADPVAAARKAVLVNSHYDSTLGTVGASDAASCIAIQLELARTLVANPAHALSTPVVFLFNGGEETLSQAANGFFTSSSYARGLGAFINLESTGPWGPAVVFQHTGDWSLAAFARAAPRPRGTTMAQDFFDLGLIPADTDYRMFSHRHYGSLPGIDIAFIFDGTAYHTARDEVSRIRPGTLQDMGHNVLAALLEFGRVLASNPPDPAAAGDGGGSVYFDLWGRCMVIYSHAAAVALHHAPLAILLLLPLLGAAAGRSQLTWLRLLGGTALAAASLLGGVALPAALGAGRALLSGTPMAWYGRPRLAYAIYLPAAAAGLMMPYVLLPRRGTAAARSAGVGLLFAAICSALTSVGMHSSFFYAFWAASAALAATFFGGGGGGVARAAALMLAFLPSIGVALPSAVTFMAHVMEKVGLAGGAPGVLGVVVADAAVGAVAGATMLLTLGSLAPFLYQALGPRAGRRVAAALLAVSLGAAAFASVAYRQPYSRDHPKRLLLQHVHKLGPDGTAQQSKLSVVGLDSFSLAPALPRSFLAQPAAAFDVEEWQAFYPLNYLISKGEARAAPGPDPAAPLPALRLLSRSAAAPSGGAREAERLELELDTGKGGAWGVMNFTGLVLGWSLSDRVATTDLPQGGVSHMVRFAGNLHARQYRFWLEIPAGTALEARVYVKHVEDSPATASLLAELPDWVSPAAVTSYHSRYLFR